MKTVDEIAKLTNLAIVDNTQAGGMGYIKHGKLKGSSVVWTRNEGGQFDHVSINGKARTPYWDEMCELKDMFFYDEEECYQMHPKKSEYVNIMPNCLHIWRRINET